MTAFKKKSVITIGIFDGVHAGHSKIIKEVVKIARKENLKSIVLTFKTIPERKKVKFKGIIKDIKTRIKLIKQLGVNLVKILDFKRVSNLNPEKFLTQILIKKYNMKYIVLGKDFRFGAGAKGNISFLKNNSKKYGFFVKIVNDVKFRGKRISSTLIRWYLKQGKIKEVEKMLGRKYFIEGKVVHGRHIGFEFPTANLKIEHENIPAKGVWIVLVTYNKKNYQGVANIGIAPTLKKEKKPLIEVYILNFNKKIYNRILKITFLKKIRNEKKFKSKKELTECVKNDIKITKNYFKKEGLHGY